MLIAMALLGALQAGQDPVASALEPLRWRLVGPFRGGRVLAVAGHPTERHTYYFGAVSGGVWRTVNDGATWENLTDGRSDISSVGAIALAPSDPNVIYVGTGEAALRENLTYGTGMYRSSDGGGSWSQIGLSDSRHIAAIQVDPKDPNLIYVAAMGHAFGPNAERGVFRSKDGGKRWDRILFADSTTGAIDLALDPFDSRILYAALYRFRRTPWRMDAGGEPSGLWRSNDGGDTWVDLSHRPGLPGSPLGRIAVAPSAARLGRLYATIQARDSAGGLFRSDDRGESWTRTSADPRLAIRPWYFSTTVAHPTNPEIVYALNLRLLQSTDGGVTWKTVPGIMADNHGLWIDSRDPNRMINGSDRGAAVTIDGGTTWSSVYNQPTAQIYQVRTDNRIPYTIFGSQQDNSSIGIASRSQAGSISLRDWFAIPSCENGHVVPDPRDPDVIYGSCYQGSLTRFDRRTGEAQDVSVRQNSYEGWWAGLVPERFQVNFPVLFSVHDSSALFVASQHLWRSNDAGHHWSRISPDLTFSDSMTLAASGGPILRDNVGNEWYGTIYSIAESPVERGVLWAGTDDGRIQLTRNGGLSWTDVTPNGMERFTKVHGIEASPHGKGIAYAAATRYQLDDFTPYLWKTVDYGRTWSRIDRGLPVGAYTRVIREDPVRRDLLFTGTEIGVFGSVDGGESWFSMQKNLPRSPVRDLVVAGSDVVVATHGRSFWVLDDIATLRQIEPADRVASARLYRMGPVIRYRVSNGEDQGGAPAADNPPEGMVVHYRVPPGGAAVQLEILDQAGKIVARFGPNSPNAPKQEPGTHRFAWSLETKPPDSIPGLKVGELFGASGPKIPPGSYRVRARIGGEVLEQSFSVRYDPSVSVPSRELEAQFRFASRARDTVDALARAAIRIQNLELAIRNRVSRVGSPPAGAAVIALADRLGADLEAVRASIADTKATAFQSTNANPSRPYSQLLAFLAKIQGADRAPLPQHEATLAELGAIVDAGLRRLAELERTRLPELNRALVGLGQSPIELPQ